MEERGETSFPISTYFSSEGQRERAKGEKMCRGRGGRLWFKKRMNKPARETKHDPQAQNTQSSNASQRSSLTKKKRASSTSPKKKNIHYGLP